MTKDHTMTTTLEELVEPSDAEQMEWPDATCAYVTGLEANNRTLQAEVDRLRGKMNIASSVLADPRLDFGVRISRARTALKTGA